MGLSSTREPEARVKPWALRHPQLGTGPVPVDDYLSAEFFAKERETIFKRVWLNVARVEETPNPGDFVVRDLAIGMTSVIVVRDQEGKIRAFHNTCKHRGNRVVVPCAGTAKAFTCGFHGWTYSLDGRLLFVPGEERFFDLDKRRLGLEPLAVDTWEGFIFVNLDPSPQDTLAVHLGELDGALLGFPFQSMTRVVMFSATVNANWKMCIDAFSEAYHVSALHRRSAPDAFSGPENPLSLLNCVRLYKLHRSISVYGNLKQRLTPAAALSVKLLGSSVYQPAADESPHSNGGGLPNHVNPGKRPDWAFDENIIFPNLSLYVANGWYLTLHYWPVAIDRTVIEYRQYLPPAQNPAQQVAQELTKVMLFDVALEDMSTLERSQVALGSGVVRYLQLSDEEAAVRHNHEVVKKFTEGEAT